MFRTAALVAWANAWSTGQASPDELLGVIPPPHDLIFPAGSLPLLPGLRHLQGTGCGTLHLVLPQPGDPVGLLGSAELLGRAIDAGAAALSITRNPALLLPTQTGWAVETTGPGSQDGVARRVAEALPQLGEAERDLRAALAAATDTLSELDLARDHPGAQEQIAKATARLGSLPAALGNRAIRLARTATEVLAIVSAARLDEGAALTGREMADRAAALAPLTTAARRALAAAVSGQAPRSAASA